jgi:hypothetical protein
MNHRKNELVLSRNPITLINHTPSKTKKKKLEKKDTERDKPIKKQRERESSTK